MWTTPDDPLREDPEYGGHNIILNRRFAVASRIEHWCLSFGDIIADDLWEEYGRVYPGSCVHYQDIFILGYSYNKHLLESYIKNL